MIHVADLNEDDWEDYFSDVTLNKDGYCIGNLKN